MPTDVPGVDKRIRTNLVLTWGFSKKNAEIAVEMFRAGALTSMEEEVITRIERNESRPWNPLVIDGFPAAFYIEKREGKRWGHFRDMAHLDYRITTEHDGQPRTPSRRRSRC